jgi:hypothetical protein
MSLKTLRFLPLLLLAASLSLHAASKPKPAAPAPAASDPYTEVQPATETLDLAMYQRIRDEGLNHSHVMEFATALMDGIGPRLTGSPNLAKANAWTRDTLTKIGLENARLEDWGEFGMGWVQLNTWARMVTPDTAVLVALDPRPGHRRRGLRQHSGGEGHRSVQRQTGRQGCFAGRPARGSAGR